MFYLFQVCRSKQKACARVKPFFSVWLNKVKVRANQHPHKRNARCSGQTVYRLTLEQTLLYLPAVAVIILIPGQDMLLSLSRGLTQGPLAGIAHALGAGLGIMAHSLLAALGVSALLTTSETAFWAMRLIGGCYLIYLGILSWRKASAVASVTSQKAP